MLVIPAIDIKDGKVVRLVQGRYEEVTIYSHDPVEMAKNWQRQGATRLHIVDLDGAKAGELKNIDSLRQIIGKVQIPVQFGGGLRTQEDIDSVLSMGAKWAILGTKACEDFNFIKEAIAKFGAQVIASIDVKFKKVAACGWTKTSEIEDVELMNKLKEIGVTSFIYTDISRDGTLSGTNISGIKRVLENTHASVIYSGGISTMADVENLKALEKLGLVGIVIGKALYEGKINLPQIKSLLEKKE